jgi:cytochrome c-type biogenesis protein
MIDPVGSTMLALTSRSPAAFGLVFLAGVVTSVGPCIAPRYIAIAAISNGDRRPILATIAFVLGLIGAFMALGFGAGLLGTLWSLSGPIDIALAVGLVGGGCVTLVRAVPAHAANAACAHGSRVIAGRQRSLGAIFLLGAASAFVISPCCTPIVAAVVATSTAIGKPLVGVGLLFCYAAGHALPLFFAGSISTVVRRIVPPQISAQAPAIVGAVLMLALGIYYGVLA